VCVVCLVKMSEFLEQAINIILCVKLEKNASKSCALFPEAHAEKL
jgi:hypothetical protein